VPTRRRSGLNVVRDYFALLTCGGLPASEKLRREYAPFYTKQWTIHATPRNDLDAPYELINNPIGKSLRASAVRRIPDGEI
jgi:hypothetical protein